MEGKTDKELVWEAIREIENQTYDPLRSHINLQETIWRDYPKEDVLRIRAILLGSGIISVLNQTQWYFQLTATGMLLKDKDLKDSGTVKKKYNPELIRGVIIATISALLGLATGTIQAKYLSENQPKMVVLPRAQLVHDTVYLKK